MHTEVRRARTQVLIQAQMDRWRSTAMNYSISDISMPFGTENIPLWAHNTWLSNRNQCYILNNIKVVLQPWFFEWLGFVNASVSRQHHWIKQRILFTHLIWPWQVAKGPRQDLCHSAHPSARYSIAWQSVKLPPESSTWFSCWVSVTEALVYVVTSERADSEQVHFTWGQTPTICLSVRPLLTTSPSLIHWRRQ